MRAMELFGEVDEKRHLQLALPVGSKPGRVRVIVLLPEEETEENTEVAWAQGLAREWAADWDDPREDIYSLADGNRRMRRGEVYLAYFPFSDQAIAKLRPVLLLTGPVGIGTEIVAAYITSVSPSALLASDLTLDPTLPEHTATGLKAPSTLRLHKFGTIHVSSIQRRLGTISSATQRTVDEKLRVVLYL